jgi:pantoate--beta-alanine ligase
VKILRDVNGIRRTVDRWKARGGRVVLVPTMGNLHDGHISLMRLARRHGDHLVASIFVNPTQFGPGEDYARYPRTPQADRGKLRNAGVDAVFIPPVTAMYPRGARNSTMVSVPVLAKDLCGAFRPGHFDGVVSVVLRLFNVIGPAAAIFGEKDYQQLIILRRMVNDLHVPVRIVGGPTIREHDGVAMSSRNQYLGVRERQAAPALFSALQGCRAQLLAGERNFAALQRRTVGRLRQAGFRPDYVQIRNALDLSRPTATARNLRVLAAAHLGRARLIDNVAVRLR